MINILPDPLLTEIFPYLDQNSQAKCRLVSKRFELFTTFSMESLDLSGRRLDVLGSYTLLNRMEHLISVRLADLRGRIDLTALPSTVTHLDLSGLTLTLGGIFELNRRTNLETLVLSRVKLPQNSVVSFASITSLNALWLNHISESIPVSFSPYISELNVSGRIEADLSFLRTLRYLTSLIAQDSGLSDEDVKYLLRNCPKIKLNIEGSKVSISKMLELYQTGHLVESSTKRGSHLNQLARLPLAHPLFDGISNEVLMPICARFVEDRPLTHPLDCSHQNLIYAAKYLALSRLKKLRVDFIFRSWKGKGAEMRALTFYFGLSGEGQLHVKRCIYAYLHKALKPDSIIESWARDALFLDSKAFYKGIMIASLPDTLNFQVKVKFYSHTGQIPGTLAARFENPELYYQIALELNPQML